MSDKGTRGNPLGLPDRVDEQALREAQLASEVAKTELRVEFEHAMRDRHIDDDERARITEKTTRCQELKTRFLHLVQRFAQRRH